MVPLSRITTPVPMLTTNSLPSGRSLKDCTRTTEPRTASYALVAGDGSTALSSEFATAVSMSSGGCCDSGL